METLWYALLGLFLAGYLVLGGYDYGVGLTLARTADPAARRQALTALGPFFLGNEVWLVASAGILFGAFPGLEGELLSGLYPALLLALPGVVLVTAAVQLRGRVAGEPARARWDRAVVAGSALAALGWGAVLAGLLQGVPPAGGAGAVLTPFVTTGALVLLALVAVHGNTFLALRLPGPAAAAAARRGARLVPVALVAVAAATAVGLASARVRGSVQQPAVALATPVLLGLLLLAVRAALRRGRAGTAFAASAAMLALPVFAVAASSWPYALVTGTDPTAGLTVTQVAAGAPTLRFLNLAAAPLLPVLLGSQLMCWWLFRGRVDGRAPVYW
ncbi:cytochrome d ubiquinol oxidase subunit II [Plantactinospora sp. KBS50]|uniref:cytochrome d ubiquinol oxidase subunit II n=1 Tax=Plantactinospora sp. KBS50 TaxID=2024580 RepID=UPI000BAACE17|nr:cytochrome d ubiquinol oxidase subunit II [Plantactinospora sp. KBS50]ASW56726.1 cytochrome D ubiquinol oxidase subunit II [Plantactinospora sp. KBS50]